MEYRHGPIAVADEHSLVWLLERAARRAGRGDRRDRSPGGRAVRRPAGRARADPAPRRGAGRRARARSREPPPSESLGRAAMSAPCVIALDLGGTSLKGGLRGPRRAKRCACCAGRRGARTAPTRSSPGCSRRSGELRLGRPPAAIGLVVPGIVDEAAGVAAFSANFGWRDVPLRALLEERHRAAGRVRPRRARRRAGRGQARRGRPGVRDFLFLRARHRRGRRRRASTGGPTRAAATPGEIGHVVVEPRRAGVWLRRARLPGDRRVGRGDRRPGTASGGVRRAGRRPLRAPATRTPVACGARPSTALADALAMYVQRAGARADRGRRRALGGRRSAARAARRRPGRAPHVPAPPAPVPGRPGRPGRPPRRRACWPGSVAGVPA